MTEPLPMVTVIIPAREEQHDIEGCLAAVAAQDYPVNRLEVIVVDGCSQDDTAAIARRALGRWGFASTAVLTNYGASASSNLNVGLERARGDIVCRVDARTRIEPHYVRTCVDLLMTAPDIAVVGGAQVAIARDPTARAVGIARALNNRWSTGGSPYRRATNSGSSDTVYLGAFRRADLLAVGGWDERLAVNQDFDLNHRMGERGRVWFDATLRSGYLPRATFGELWRQYLRFGRGKVVYWRLTGHRPQPRQRLLLAGPMLGLLLLALTPSRLKPAFLSVVALGAGIVEWKGASTPVGGPAAHLHGVAAIAVTSGGWLVGVITEASGRSQS